MNWNVADALHCELAAICQQAARKVAGLLPQIRIGSAYHYGLHLRNGIDQSRAQHSKRNRVEIGTLGHEAVSIKRLA